MKSIFYFIIILLFLSNCGDLVKRDSAIIYLKLLTQENLNNQNFAIFEVKTTLIQPKSKIKLNLSNRDTLSVNGVKFDSVIYLISRDSLKSNVSSWVGEISSISLDNSYQKYSHLQKITIDKSILSPCYCGF